MASIKSSFFGRWEMMNQVVDRIPTTRCWFWKPWLFKNKKRKTLESTCVHDYQSTVDIDNNDEAYYTKLVCWVWWSVVGGWWGLGWGWGWGRWWGDGCGSCGSCGCSYSCSTQLTSVSHFWIWVVCWNRWSLWLLCGFMGAKPSTDHQTKDLNDLHWELVLPAQGSLETTKAPLPDW